MKKIIQIIMFLIFGIISNASKTSYIMVPENYEELYLIGIDESGKKWELETEDELIGGSEKISIASKNYYNQSKLLKLNIDTTKDIKIVLGYATPNAGGATSNYTILATSDIKIDRLEENYADGSKIDVIKFGDGYPDYTYDTFPGHLLNDNVMLVGIRVGSETKEESDEKHSNIIGKITSTDEIDAEDMGINIKPSNSHNEFIMKAKSPDDTVYVFKKDKKDPDNYLEINDDEFEGLLIKEIVITVQNGGDASNKIVIDGKLITFEKNTTYTIIGDLIVDISGKSNKKKIKFTGDINSLVPAADEELSEEVYLIESENLYYTGNVNVRSGNHENRNRISDIEINIVENEGEGIQIKSIK